MINKLTSELQQKIDSIFATWNQPDSPGCALLISQGDEVIYERGYGSAQLEYNIPITPNSIFHVASVSKQFTAAAIALLAADGVIELDAPVQQYVPEVPEFDQKITVRQLVHHTSGLRDQWELLVAAGWRFDDVITKDHIMKMVRRQRELNFEPGSEYLYCNTGYTLMAEIVERVTGKTLRQFADERIFQPLGMNDTHFHDDHEEIVPNRAYSYALRQSGSWRKSVLSYANVGATSLFTTVRDLSKWLFNFSHGQVGGAQFLEQMHEKYLLNNGETVPYGFGLMFAEHKGLQEVGHSGADAGFRSWCGRIVNHDLGIVILANFANAVPRELARQVAEVLLADHLTEAEAATAKVEEAKPEADYALLSDQLVAYTGQYYSPELDTTYAINLQDQELVITFQRHPDAVLVPLTCDTFRRKTAPQVELKFVRNSDGELTGFKLSGGRIRNVAFERK